MEPPVCVVHGFVPGHQSPAHHHQELPDAIWSRVRDLHLGHRGPSHCSITVTNHVAWTGTETSSLTWRR